MKYSLDQLPFGQFEQLGMDRNSVMSLPETTMNALLSGNRTSLIRFCNIKNEKNAKLQPLDAKLSLKKNRNGELSLKVHPIWKNTANTFDLSEKEINYLKNQELAFVPKMVSKDGKPVEALIAYDNTTNEFIAIERDELRAPDKINGTQLSEGQRKDFVDGKPVVIRGKKYRLNPTNELGISGPDLSTVQIGHSAYKLPNLYMDAALITAGLGHFIMLYHLANVIAHSKFKMFNVEKNLQNEPFRNALASAKMEILQRQDFLSKAILDEDGKPSKSLSIDDIKEILEKKAGEHIIAENIHANPDEQTNSLTDIKASLKEDEPDNDLSIEEERPRSVSFRM